MEVSKLSSTMDLNLLASADLCLDLRGGNWIVTSVKLVQLTINVLRHSDCVESARHSGLFVTGGRHGWQMHGVDRLYAMEVVVVHNSDVGVVESTAHHVLCVRLSPGVTMETGGNSRVLGLMAVAGRLEMVATFHLDTLQEGFKYSLRVVLDFRREVVSDDLADELNDCGTETLSCSLIVHIGNQISLLDGLGGVTGQIAHVTGAFEGEDGEHVFLSCLDIDR